MTPFEIISRIYNSAATVLFWLMIIFTVIIITLIGMAAYDNYVITQNLAKAQYACGEYGNGRAWSAAKRKDFLSKLNIERTQ